MKLTPEQMHGYFEARLGRALQFGRNILIACPFHEDRTPSFSLDAAKGIWHCHAGCGAGGVIDFEKRFSSCDGRVACSNILEVCGLPSQPDLGAPEEAVYSYKDEHGVELFQKVRNPGKHFIQRTRDESGKWTFKLADTRRILYHLPAVITANIVLLAEGEKDCDNLDSMVVPAVAKKYPAMRVASTTNPDGAGKWRAEFSPYFAGKDVAIFQDNDDIGKNHAQAVAKSIAPYAHSIKVIELPGLEPKGDVSDYLKTHTAEDLLAIVAYTPRWSSGQPELVVSAPSFLSTGSLDIEWMVDRIIQRGANGFICSYPKVGKSWLAADLAIALALGSQWIGFDIPRPVRTALITREDNPALTKWRMDRLLRGRGRERHELDGRLFVNSREQSPDFKLDKPELYGPLVASLRESKPEFVILDVFNVMHRAEENDNSEMSAVMAQLSALQRDVGCAIGVVHHFTKTAEGSLTQRLRGASAIAGWAEWLVGVEAIPQDSRTRKLTFEVKATGAMPPVFYEVKSDEADTRSTIERIEFEQPRPKQGFREIII